MPTLFHFQYHEEVDKTKNEKKKTHQMLEGSKEKKKEGAIRQGMGVYCNERDRLASKHINCQKAYSFLKIDEE